MTPNIVHGHFCWSLFNKCPLFQYTLLKTDSHHCHCSILCRNLWHKIKWYLALYVCSGKRGILSYSKLMLNIQTRMEPDPNNMLNVIRLVYLISLIVICLTPNVDIGEGYCQTRFTAQKHTFFFCNTLRHHLNYKTVFLLKFSFQTICQAKSGANRNLPPPMLIERSRWRYRLLSLIPGKTLNWFSLTGDHRTIGSIPTQKLNPTPTLASPDVIFHALVKLVTFNSDNDQDVLRRHQGPAEGCMPSNNRPAHSLLTTANSFIIQ